VVAGPDHPGLPARVSLLMFPALGTVAGLLAPRVASAVLGSGAAASTASALRPYIRLDRLED